jgi:hypothetical protein
MKLRIRGNSIRLRLTQGEVQTLAEKGRVEDAIAFAPGSRLVYALATSDSRDALAARLDGARVEVTLPSALAKDWAASTRVGIEGEQPIGEGEPLRILVEKDFACLHPRKGEDDRDAFANPNDSCD